MELMSLSWEMASRSATQEIPKNLWSPKCHYHVHKNPPLLPILSQIKTLHATTSYSSKIKNKNKHTIH
jgi:hypothetical protein